MDSEMVVFLDADLAGLTRSRCGEIDPSLESSMV